MEFSCIKMSQDVPKPYEPFGWDINFKVDLSNWFKKMFHALILQVSNTSNLKAELDKLYIDKQINTSSCWYK